jgi:membrane-associated protease RseP (regulator of RpoE activity)
VPATVAAVSGVLAGDVILAIGGEPVGSLSYDDALTVLRGAAASGMPITLSMEGGGGDGNDGAPAMPPTATKSGRNVTLSRLRREPGEGLGMQLVRTSADGCGLSVHGVVPATVAAVSGVLAGDIILAIGGEPVGSLPYDDALAVLHGAAASGMPITLSMEGGGGDGDNRQAPKWLQATAGTEPWDASSAAAAATEMSAKWPCPACTFRNEHSAQKCGMCRAEQPSAVTSVTGSTVRQRSLGFLHFQKPLLWNWQGPVSPLDKQM